MKTAQTMAFEKPSTGDVLWVLGFSLIAALFAVLFCTSFTGYAEAAPFNELTRAPEIAVSPFAGAKCGRTDRHDSCREWAAQSEKERTGGNGDDPQFSGHAQIS